VVSASVDFRLPPRIDKLLRETKYRSLEINATTVEEKGKKEGSVSDIGC
jgi:hypothetical protein